MKFIKSSLICALAGLQLIGFSIPSSSSNATAEVINAKSDATAVNVMDEITSHLLSMYEQTRNISSLPVMVWFDDVDSDLVQEKIIDSLDISLYNLSSLKTNSLSRDNLDKFISTKRNVMREMYSEYNEEKAVNLFDTDDIMSKSVYAPAIIANLTYDEVKNLLQEDSVKCIGYFDNSVEEELSLANDITRTSNVIDDYEYTGDGVTIGIFEIGVPDAEIEGMNIEGILGDNEREHATLVSSIIYDIAPDADYYIAHQADVWTESVEWLLDNDVDIINASLRIGANTDTNSYTTTDLWLEHVSYHHCVTFVKSAGNSGSNGITSGGMAYNVITVGSVSDGGTRNYADDDISGFSSFYDSADNTGDIDYGVRLAYKPDICAPGENIATSTFPYNTSDGTSLAAPQVTAAIALMLEHEPDLTLYPEVIKAILTAGVNVDSPHVYVPGDWDEDEDSYQQFGAGILDTEASCEIINNGTYEDGVLTSSRTSREYTIDVNSSDDRIRISLVFLRNAWATSSHTDEDDVDNIELADIDLYLYDPEGDRVASSTTSNNNIEIIDYVFEASGEYTIKVKQFGSTDEDTLFGLAWIVY